MRRDAFPFLTTWGRTSWHPLLGKSKNRASQEHQAPSHSNRTRRNRRSPEIEAPKKRCRTVRQSLPHPRKISCRNTCPHRPPPRTRRPALPIRLHDKAPFRISGRPQTSPNSTPPPISRTTQSLQLARSTRSHRRYCRALENRDISSRNMHAPKSIRTSLHRIFAIGGISEDNKGVCAAARYGSVPRTTDPSTRACPRDMVHGLEGTEAETRNARTGAQRAEAKLRRDENGKGRNGDEGHGRS